MTERAPLDHEMAVLLADFFTAMSDPTRVRIISILAEPCSECSVQDLAAALGVSPSAVSHQLRFLRQLRVVKARRQGRSKLYSLDDAHIVQLYHEGLAHVQHG